MIIDQAAEPVTLAGEGDPPAPTSAAAAAEELGRRAYIAYRAAYRARSEWDIVPPAERQRWIAAARAVRRALLERGELAVIEHPARHPPPMSGDPPTSPPSAAQA